MNKEKTILKDEEDYDEYVLSKLEKAHDAAQCPTAKTEYKNKIASWKRKMNKGHDVIESINKRGI